MEPSQPRDHKLDDLPENKNKDFWGDAEVKGGIVPQKIHNEEAHFFIRKSGRDVQCTHCDWGFYLDPGDVVRDGKVYDAKGKLII